MEDKPSLFETKPIELSSIKTDSITLRFIKRIPQNKIQEILKNAQEHEHVCCRHEIGDGIIIDTVHYANHRYYWTIIINDQLMLRDGVLRIDGGAAECLEVEGRDLKEIIDHPLFRGITIKKARMVSHANRRDGITLKLDKTIVQIREEQDWNPIGVGEPVRPNPKYAGLRRLFVPEIFAEILKQANVECNKIQQIYEAVNWGRYHSFHINASLNIYDKGILPASFEDFKNDLRGGRLYIPKLLIRQKDGTAIEIRAERNKPLRVTIQNNGLPQILQNTLVGKRLSEVIGLNVDWRGPEIRKIQKSKNSLQFTCESRFVELP